MEKILEVKGLTKLYKNNRGIKNISFDVYRGDVFGFLGPNGAGKTTVMKIITGLSRPDAGEVKIFGFRVLDQFEKAMGKVGCIIETACAYEYMSAYKNLELAGRYYDNVTETRIKEVLDLFGLGRYKNEKVGHYSLGMKQRLGLAAAILSKPDLVILDEPTNGLDVKGMIDVRNTILQLARQEGITFFISSHLIHEVELMCNRIGIINDGKLLKEGLVNTLLDGGETSLEDFFVREIDNSGEYPSAQSACSL